MQELNDKTVIVTGSVQGIGFEIASLFAAEGSNVVINSRGNKTELDEAKNLIAEKNSNVKAVLADISKISEAKKVIDSALDFNGSIDILINNAGGLIERVPISDYNEKHFDKVVSSNLKTAFAMTSLAIPIMEKQNSGHIINFSSQAGYDGGGPGVAAYAAAKAGIVAFTKSLVKELVGKNINCNAVSPGFIEKTNFHDTFTSKDVHEMVKKNVPLRRLGNASEVAELVLFLCSKKASYINGATIQINGGLLLV